MTAMPSWMTHLPDGGQARDVSDKAITKAKSDATRLVAESDRLCAEGLISAAAEATRIAVLIKPGSATALWQPFWPVFAKAQRDLATTRTAAAAAGVLSFATLVMSHGGYVPDFFDRQTRVGLEHETKWLEELAGAAKTAGATVDGDAKRLLGFAALAIGRPDLATALSTDSALATLASVLSKPAHEASRAFISFIASFPTAIHKYGELGFAARAFVCHVERRGVGGIGAAAAWLHRVIHEGHTNQVTPAVVNRVVGKGAASLPIATPAVAVPVIDPALVARSRALFSLEPPRPPRTTAWSSIAIDDVHALHGGRSIRINATGAVETIDVARGLGSARLFRAVLSLATLDELVALLRVNPPRSIMTSRRLGVAGEGRPVIELTATSGTYSVGKWSNDHHREFDAIATFLAGIATVHTATTAPAQLGRWEGRFIAT